MTLSPQTPVSSSAMLNLLPKAALLVNAEGIITNMNAAASKLGCHLSCGQCLPAIMTDASQAWSQILDRQQSGHAALPCEFEAWINMCQLRFAVGPFDESMDGCIVQLTDITEFRLRSIQTAKNEQRFRCLFSENPNAVFSLSPDGALTSANKSTQVLTGLSGNELIDQHWLTLIDPMDREMAMSNFHSALEGSSCSYRCRLSVSKPSQPIAHVTLIPIFIDEQVAGIFGIAQDKTRTYKLEEQSRLLRTSLAQIKDVIVITEVEPLNDPGPKIVFVNEAIQNTTGYRMDELLGKTPRMLQGQDTSREALDRIRLALEQREPVREVLINYCKDGMPFWNEIEIVPIPSRHIGEREYFASVQRDVTDAKRRELELHRSKEELRRLNSAQEDLLEQERQRISRDLHDDLGQTLTALKLNLGMTLRDIPQLSKDDQLHIRSQLDAIDGVIDRVRKISSNLRPPMLDDLGFEATAEWFLGQCAGHQQVDIHWHFNQRERIRAQGDTATTLYRILQECMTNVTRHSGAKRVDVWFSESADKAILEVQDDGRGFDPAQATSGFGLVSMRERVAALNGELVIESAIDSGVRIQVTLPLDAHHD